MKKKESFPSNVLIHLLGLKILAMALAVASAKTAAARMLIMPT
jgi:hypothetical protein